MRKRILIIDDEENMRHMLTALLTDSGYEVDSLPDAVLALKKIQDTFYQFIFCDVRMPNMDGMAFLRASGKILQNSNVIMMSAYGTIDMAIEAMKLGAYDYISKPFKPDEVLLTLKKAEERERLKTENIELKERIQAISDSAGFGSMIGKSKAIQSVYKLAAKVAQFDTTVLITGESGTGKELVAKGIHFSGKRADKPLIPVNCGGIPETLLESEMFGYKKGAFTGADRNYKGLFEAADGGTIFLDEVGDLPLSLQVKLLRFLQDNEIRPIGDTQTKQVDVRIITATSKNLESEVKKGHFREDLFYRLNVLPIHLPPLVERTEDIPSLSQHFISQFNYKLGKHVKGISSAAMSLLLSYDWPGNVRELENIIERAVVLAEEDILRPENFSTAITSGMERSRMDEMLKGFSLKTSRELLEKKMIRRALEATGGNRTQAAKLLEISHPSLLSKIKLYNISSE
ncbi:MAG: sigma-54 dependent transcriptional regulator [Desulfobacterales bacterium]|jgi:two-component system response regulator AtoC|nr:sigma-54 dependent transcriptional regulator [Desulfobacterales bacterium]